MAQQADPPDGARSPRTVSDDLRMADAGRERVVYMRAKLRKQLLTLHQQTAWVFEQLETGSLREREAAEQLATIEEVAEDLSVVGDALAASARDRDVHLDDAVDRGVARAANASSGSGESHGQSE